MAARIRAYRTADRAALPRLVRESEPWITLGYGDRDWEPLFDALARGQGREGYVAELDGRVSGLAILRRRFLVGDYLELLAVAPEARGHGVGRALLEHVERQVFAQAPNLFVCVSDFNEAARRFYARHGYQEVGPLRELLIAGHAEILLRKTTGPARELP